MKTTAIIQARMTSSRLPGKVLGEILGRPMLSCMIERVRQATRIDRIVIATTTNVEDDPVAALAQFLQVDLFRGSEENVLERFFLAARTYASHGAIMRLTGDCPLLDPELLDSLVDFFEKEQVDYASNCLEPTLPDGLDAEIFSFSALASAFAEARLPSELEHVTPFIRNHPERFAIGSWRYPQDLSRYRWTVDEPEDFELVQQIFSELYPADSQFRLRDILTLMLRVPQLAEINCHYHRNEGLARSLQSDEKFLKKTGAGRPEGGMG